MRVLNTRFIRLLRLNDIEFFQVALNDNEKLAYLLYIDERYPESLKDGNQISVYLISDFELSDSSYEDVLSFSDDLLGMKYNCSYILDTLTVEEEFTFNFPYEMLAVRTYVQELLAKLNIDKKLPVLEESDFNYLSQQRLVEE